MTQDNSRPECIDPSIGALLVSYALGALSESQSEQFEQHVLNCPACQLELEEASSALETLSDVREQFVARARFEKEDFRSQFKRLEQNVQPGGLPITGKESLNWWELMWMALWGRRWIVGTVGVVAVVVLLTLRHGPGTVQPPISNNLIPEAPALLSKKGIDTVAKRSVEPQSQGADMGNAPLPEVRSSVSPAESKQKQVSDRSLAKLSEHATLKEQETSPDVVKDVMAGKTEQPIPAQSEIALPSGAEEAGTHASDVAEAPFHYELTDVDLESLADAALGLFDPQQYAYSGQEIPAERLPSAQAFGYSMSAVQERSTANRMIVADSMMAQRRYDEARGIFEQQLKADSTDARLLLMIGVASLAKDDLEHANQMLKRAFAVVPRNKTTNSAGLLLARTEILQGRLDEAKTQLQLLARISDDADLVRLAIHASSRIDSLKIKTPAIKPLK